MTYARQHLKFSKTNLTCLGDDIVLFESHWLLVDMTVVADPFFPSLTCSVMSDRGRKKESKDEVHLSISSSDK